MERIGDSSPYDPSHHVDWAYRACKDAPAAIQPGAVVKMAEALEHALPFMRYNYPSPDCPEVIAMEEALNAYYGKGDE